VYARARSFNISIPYIVQLDVGRGEAKWLARMLGAWMVMGSYLGFEF